MVLGGIEAGGTKFVCAVSDNELNIIERLSIPTTTPSETVKKVVDFFKRYPIEALGVGSFGPIDVNKDSKTYGYITNTPKVAWQNYDFVGTLSSALSVPIGWTTDVNAAALGEITFGAAKGKKSCVYITVGTGIGGGAVVNGHLLEGYGHPEMGHLLVRLHEDDSFEGNCPFHHNCLEGLASGPAIEKRLNEKASNLPVEHDYWQIEADYLAQAVMNYTLILSPEMIVFGGGVMKQEHLFPLIREAYSKKIAHYVEVPPLDQYIVPCGLGDNAGIKGCLILAEKTLDKNRTE
ncbi:ROK family protein [Vagococcus lutrae]|uniref:Fructokinase n=1 Tax=Vagococcus lutrae TaxID=81947 RepID=A0AAF0BJ65_9ENTE|nr:ROK family protein [Vagococcus lutrae]MDO5741928.1 ROK family protein [Vagococcus sp.]WCG23661.1 ROK family protein [Vagococcus lutrae]